MTTRDPAPSGLRRLATLATLATTVLALAGLPASELPLAWLLMSVSAIMSCSVMRAATRGRRPTSRATAESAAVIISP